MGQAKTRPKIWPNPKLFFKNQSNLKNFFFINLANLMPNTGKIDLKMGEKLDPK